MIKSSTVERNKLSLDLPNAEVFEVITAMASHTLALYSSSSLSSGALKRMNPREVTMRAERNW